VSSYVDRLKKRAVRAQRKAGLGIADRSPFDNIYHCCVQRTASQWFRLIFNDPSFYRHTGLYVVPYIEAGLNDASITEAFPPRTMAVHLYINHGTYDAIPKPASHRGFFVTRDPRDILVSFYFAARHSHRPIAVIPTLRRQLTNVGEEEGLAITLDALTEMGLFEAQRSWGAPQDTGGLAVFRYEDLAADHRVFLRRLFDHLQVPMPDDELEELCHRKSFEAVTGRPQGTEDVNSHLRKGIAGDWREHMTPALLSRLDEATGGLPAELGY
jgi:hypothetical protein